MHILARMLNICNNASQQQFKSLHAQVHAWVASSSSMYMCSFKWHGELAHGCRMQSSTWWLQIFNSRDGLNQASVQF